MGVSVLFFLFHQDGFFLSFLFLVMTYVLLTVVLLFFFFPSGGDWHVQYLVYYEHSISVVSL